MGDAIPIPKPGKDPCRPESHRPITLLSVLLKLAEGMIHRRLSALLPHHPRQLRICTSASCVGRGGTCYRQITRGLNEFGIVEYERPGERRPPRLSPSLVVSIDFPTAFDTTDHGNLFCMLDGLPAPWPRTKRWLHNYLRGRYVVVCTREQHSRKQLASAGAPQGGVPGPQLSLYCVDDLPAPPGQHSILPPHSCTLDEPHFLPQVRTSMPVLRQCDRSCLLWPHGCRAQPKNQRR
ncbi:hypothetical protein TcBrA4_0105660 [Trypanosoma cruzi]|nr:hypothetical protein TcBrA4_0105660 [Trypanosoma cruzi]